MFNYATVKRLRGWADPVAESVQGVEIRVQPAGPPAPIFRSLRRWMLSMHSRSGRYLLRITSILLDSKIHHLRRFLNQPSSTPCQSRLDHLLLMSSTTLTSPRNPPISCALWTTPPTKADCCTLSPKDHYSIPVACPILVAVRCSAVRKAVGSTQLCLHTPRRYSRCAYVG